MVILSVLEGSGRSCNYMDIHTITSRHRWVSRVRWDETRFRGERCLEFSSPVSLSPSTHSLIVRCSPLLRYSCHSCHGMTDTSRYSSYSLSMSNTEVTYIMVKFVNPLLLPSPSPPHPMPLPELSSPPLTLTSTPSRSCPLLVSPSSHPNLLSLPQARRSPARTHRRDHRPLREARLQACRAQDGPRYRRAPREPLCRLEEQEVLPWTRQVHG